MSAKTTKPKNLDLVAKRRDLVRLADAHSASFAELERVLLEHEVRIKNLERKWWHRFRKAR